MTALCQQYIFSSQKKRKNIFFAADKGLSLPHNNFGFTIINHLKNHVMNNATAEALEISQVITTDELLVHWQGHRSLTRKIIEAFPEEAFFKHSIGGMRTFAEMAMELLGIAGPGIREIATGEINKLNEHVEHGNSKEKLLQLWDEATVEINNWWVQIKPERFRETIKLFGQYEGSAVSSILYFIDNEIHHRGQGYVYLRSLGIEPPAFWDRQFI